MDALDLCEGEEFFDVLLGTVIDEDGVENNGAGPVYEQLVSAIMSQHYGRIALIGHSHGGGSVHDLCARLDSEDVNLAHNAEGFPDFEAILTAYVDAIQNTTDYTTEAEVRRSPGTLSHANL